jgi:hypothetical protein
MEEILKFSSYGVERNSGRITVFEKVIKTLFSSKTSIDVGVRKLQEIITRGNKDHLLFRMERLASKFMCGEYSSVVGYDYSVPFRLMSNKDIWGLYRALIGMSETDKYVCELPFLDRLKKEIQPFAEEILSKSKIDFYYGEVFPDEDLSRFDVSFVDIPFRPPVDGRSCEEYFDSLKKKKDFKASENMTKYSYWFDDNISVYFDLLVKYLLKGVSRRDLLFMDIVKSLACNDIGAVLRYFGVSESVANLLLSESPEYVLPTSNPYEISARYILENYEYEDAVLREYASNLEGDELIGQLLSDMESLLPEFSGATKHVKDALRLGLGFVFDDE